jgi:hypothetical protein
MTGMRQDSAGSVSFLLIWCASGAGKSAEDGSTPVGWQPSAGPQRRHRFNALALVGWQQPGAVAVQRHHTVGVAGDADNSLMSASNVDG